MTAPYQQNELTTKPVISRWLSAALVSGLVVNVVASAWLILQLSGYDERRAQAERSETQSLEKRSELASLQAEVDSLTKKKIPLAAEIADWEARLKEKTQAQAAFASLESKRAQAEADTVAVAKKLDDLSTKAASLEKEKVEATSERDSLRAEIQSLSKQKAELKATLAQAVDAERRLSDAQTALANAETRKKNLDADVTSARTRFDQLEKQSNDARAEMDEQQTTASAAVAQLKTEISTLTKTLGETKSKMDQVLEAERRLSEAQSALTNLETRKKNLEADLTAAQARFNNLEKDSNNAREVKTTAEAAAVTLRTQITFLKDELTTNSTKVAELNAAREQLNKDCTDAVKQRDKTKSEEQTALDNLAAATKNLQDVAAKQGELTREAARLEASVEKLKSEKIALLKGIGQVEGQKNAKPDQKNEE